MNKSMILGMGIFIVILSGLLSLSTTADVNAQSILGSDTNIAPSMIHYQVDISELGLMNLYDISYDNSTNITSVMNTTHVIDYECGLFIGELELSYIFAGTTSVLNDTIIINQSFNETLADNYYNITLNCTYYINTTNSTSIALGNYEINNTINETIMDLTLILSSKNIVTYKTILVDTHAPVISIQNLSVLRHNGTADILVEIFDITPTSCTFMTESYITDFNAKRFITK